jgi:hypothetical protein
VTDPTFTRWRIISFSEDTTPFYLAIKTTVTGYGSSPIIDAKPRLTWSDAARDGINTGLAEWQDPNRR